MGEWQDQGRRGKPCDSSGVSGSASPLAPEGTDNVQGPCMSMTCEYPPEVLQCPQPCGVKGWGTDCYYWGSTGDHLFHLPAFRLRSGTSSLPSSYYPFFLSFLSVGTGSCFPYISGWPGNQDSPASCSLVLGCRVCRYVPMLRTLYVTRPLSPDVPAAPLLP